MSGWDEKAKDRLGSYGRNVFIGHNVIFTCPHLVHLGDNVRIDPFTLITTQLTTGNNVFIGAQTIFSGGAANKITLGNWTCTSYGSKFFCGSEDYSGEYGPVGDCWGHNLVHHGSIVLNDYVTIASDVLVMPGCEFPEGCAIGAKSLVRKTTDLEPYTIYLGNPLRYHGKRNQQKILDAITNPDFHKFKL